MSARKSPPSPDQRPIETAAFFLPATAERWRCFANKNINTVVFVLAVRFAPQLHLDGIHWSLLFLVLAETLIFFIGGKIQEKLAASPPHIKRIWIYASDNIALAETFVTVLIVNVLTAYIQSRLNDEAGTFATVAIPISLIILLNAISMFGEYRLSRSLHHSHHPAILAAYASASTSPLSHSHIASHYIFEEP